MRLVNYQTFKLILYYYLKRSIVCPKADAGNILEPNRKTTVKNYPSPDIINVGFFHVEGKFLKF